MSKRSLVRWLGVLCTLGLGACGQTEPETSATQTLRLNRLASGDLEYCDERGECQSLPYGGECVALEIDIDLRTGETCQRCLLEDGTRVDQGCGATAVGCVLVTLPEPDCVVCAYVNGAVIFSSCIAEEPGCRSDEDCVSAGIAARCIDGQCVAEPGCSSDLECPAGFVCQLDVCPMVDCGSEMDCIAPPCTGTCVPAPTECFGDEDCPAGMACRLYCMGACPEGRECDVFPCMGVCEPVAQECFSDADCPAGFICELYGLPEPAPGDAADRLVAPAGICVPQQTGCLSDADCPMGMACETSCLPCAAPDGALCDAVCQGVCVQVETYCGSDADCLPGEICERVDFAGAARPAGEGDPMAPPSGVCVPAPMRCTSDFECNWDGFGLGICWNGECLYTVSCDTTQALCDMIPPTCEAGLVPSVIGGCFGPCVDPAMCVEPAPCVVSGCSGEICAAAPAFSTCEERPAFDCLGFGICELQPDGQCGWTLTDEAVDCLAQSR